VGEEEREAFGSGDEGEGEFFIELGFLIAGGVAGADGDFDFEVEISERFEKRFLSVVGESSKWS